MTLDLGTPAYPSPVPSQRSPPARRSFRQLRRRPRWPLLALVGLAALVAATPFVAAYVVSSVVLPRLGQRYGVVVHVNRVQVRPTRVRLSGLSVRSVDAEKLPAPLQTQRCDVEFAPLQLLRGRIELTTVTLSRADIQLGRGGDDDNISALLGRLRHSAPGPAGAEPPSRGWVHGPQSIVLTNATMEVRDELGTLRAAGLEATLQRQGDCQVSLREAAIEPASGAAASADEVIVRWRSPERFLPAALPEVQIRGGAVTPWKRLAMTGIAGTIKPDPNDATRAAIELAGGYGGVDKELWRARGWVRRPQGESSLSHSEGALSLRAERFRLSQLEPILKDTPIIDADKTDVDANLELTFVQGTLSFSGSFRMAGLSVFSPRLVAEPVRDLGFDISAGGKVELKTRKVKLDRAAIRWNGAEVDIDAEAEAQPLRQVVIDHPAGAPAAPSWRERWRTVALHIVVPPIDCQAMLAAMPQPIVPRIRDFKLAGTFSTDVRVFVDFAKLLRLPPPKDLDDDEGGADAPPAVEPPPPPPPVHAVVNGRRGGRRGGASPSPQSGKEPKDPQDNPVQVSGQVGIQGCRVLKAPPEMDATRFLGSFTHTVLVEPGRELSFVIGPEDPDYVPFEELSPYLINSIMTTEDNGFLRHRGFITPEFRSALQSNLERGYFRLGASSITMQMVKNVLLSREKTLSRKLQEMFLTWYLENNLTDDQDLIKALAKGYSVSQYRQQQAKLKKPVVLEVPVPAAAPAPPAAPVVPSAPGAPPTQAAPPPPPAVNLAIAKPFAESPTGQANLYAVAQARQALREISPIKKRILEIYFNAIEFGPYIYGIGRATRHYFGKSPKDLTPREASFFSSILPNPKRRYIQYCKGAADDGWEKYVDRIVRRVHSRGRLSDEELLGAVSSRLVFDRAEAMPDKDCPALIQHLTELPPPAAIGLPPPGVPPGPNAAQPATPKPATPLPGEKPFPLPPWIEMHSGGHLRYRPPQKAEEVPEPVQF